MNFEAFRACAHEVFDGIPTDFRDGVDGLEVVRKTVAHPSLPEVYTLGECLSELYPSDYGGAGEIRSRVVLYYGSFLAISRKQEDGWDWEDEIYETVTHEIRHHLEHLASEDALEEMDYAEDQNFARREGEPFDPHFYRSGKAVGPAAFEVDGDVFVELELNRRALAPGSIVTAEWRGEPLRVGVPDEVGDVHFLRVEGALGEGEAELCVVLIRRRTLGESIRGLFGLEPLRILESDAHLETGG